MNTNRGCGCKSFRTCVVCETEHGLKPWDWGRQLLDENRKFYDLDLQSGKCLDSNNRNVALENFSGIRIIPNFISQTEEIELIKNLDLLPWDSSQSGRRKQNFGPRANFKKRKVKNGSFHGFPQCTRFIQERFSSVPLLAGYRPVEQCSIEYRPQTGAAIEPHIDDCWVWGERIVQLNLLSDSFLTCVPYRGGTDKYNLADVTSYPKLVDSAGSLICNPFIEKLGGSPYEFENNFTETHCAVKIPLPARSLLIMYGSARYEWEHGVLREDVTDRRVVLAYRELTPPYLPGGREDTLGSEILSNAQLSW